MRCDGRAKGRYSVDQDQQLEGVIGDFMGSRS